ncbi:MAG: UDP-glucose/GDP-mannose dehydrogenase family protein [Chloroflexi bacterium]|nr:UDP-glucose/GDP-mannose dehydrogenase family protein [Chloroflexota bacterium]
MSLSKNGQPIIGIVGLGVLGGATHSYFEGQGYALRVFDPYKGHDDERGLNEAEVIFICVPTPYRPGAGFDDSALEDAISRLASSKVVVIKSTVLPGTTEAYQFRYSQHCFLFNPEFLRTATAREDFVQPDRQIVGYCAQSRHLAEELLAMLPAAPFQRIMVAREAELTKYMTNSFLALKVTFGNELFDLATALDIDYDVVREAVSADERIGPSHLSVLQDNYRGYGGKCLPKDTKALMDLADRLDVPLRLLRTADRINATLLPPSELPPATLHPLPVSSNGDREEMESEEQAA